MNDAPRDDWTHQLIVHWQIYEPLLDAMASIFGIPIRYLLETRSSVTRSWRNWVPSWIYCSLRAVMAFIADFSVRDRIQLMMCHHKFSVFIIPKSGTRRLGWVQEALNSGRDEYVLTTFKISPQIGTKAFRELSCSTSKMLSQLCPPSSTHTMFTLESRWPTGPCSTNAFFKTPYTSRPKANWVADQQLARGRLRNDSDHIG